MADIISTLSIAISKMKMRWEEPYVSEAANKLMSSMPRGVYRGFVPGIDATEKKIQLNVDTHRGDSFFLCSDNTNGFTVGVREDAVVELDATALFPLTGDETWYVWAEIDYSVSSATVGKYHLTDTVPTGNFVRLLKLNMTNGDTKFDVGSNFDTSWADTPEPTKNKTGSYSAGDIEYGLLSGVEAWRNPDEDQKDAMDNATSPSSSNPFVTKSETKDKVMGDAVIKSVLGLSGDTEFQIMGWFYVGKGTNLDATKYFHLRAVGPALDYPLYGSDYKEIVVSSIRDSSSSADLNPATDPGVDSAGYYQNPYIRMDFQYTKDSTFTGDLKVHCIERAVFSALPQTPASTLPNLIRDLIGNAATTMAGDQSGNYTDTPLTTPAVKYSWTAKSLQNILKLLLDAINFKTIAPQDASSTWQLLWRSNNIVNDADVVKDTISIYWRGNKAGGIQGTWGVIVGGYLNGEDVVAGGGIYAGNVLGFGMKAGMVGDSGLFILGVKANPTGGTTWTWDDAEDWDVFWGIGQGGIYQRGKPLWLYGDGSYVRGDNPESVGNTWMLLFESPWTSYPWPRIYFGEDGSGNNGIAITWNASWDEGNSWWERDSALEDSFGVFIGEYFSFIRHDKDDGATWANGVWTSQSVSGNTTGKRMNAFGTVIGNVYDMVKYSLYGSTMGLGGGAKQYPVCAVTWHSKLNDID